MWCTGPNLRIRFDIGNYMGCHIVSYIRTIYCKRVLTCLFKSVFKIFNSHVIVRITFKPKCWLISHTVIETRGSSRREAYFFLINYNLTALEEIRFTDATYWLTYNLNFHCFNEIDSLGFIENSAKGKNSDVNKL